MRKALWIGAGAAIAGALVITAATGAAGPNPKADPSGPAIHKKRAAADVGAASVRAAHHRSPVVRKFRARNATNVPANGASSETFMLCPRRWLVIGAGYDTDGFVPADVFRPQGPRRWRFRFYDDVGLPGQAFEWIVCMRRR